MCVAFPIWPTTALVSCQYDEGGWVKGCAVGLKIGGLRWWVRSRQGRFPALARHRRTFPLRRSTVPIAAASSCFLVSTAWVLMSTSASRRPTVSARSIAQTTNGDAGLVPTERVSRRDRAAVVITSSINAILLPVNLGALGQAAGAVGRGLLTHEDCGQTGQ